MNDDKLILYIKLFSLTFVTIFCVFFVDHIVDNIIIKWLIGWFLALSHSYMLNFCVLEYKNKLKEK